MTSLEEHPTPTAATEEVFDADVVDLRRAPVPLAATGASRVAVALALAVVAAGVVGIRDGLAAAGWIGGGQWLPSAIDAVDGLGPAAWMVPAGVGVGAVGIALMVIAVLPRRRTAVPLNAESAVYLARGDVGKLASGAASSVAGVLEARTTSSRRKAVVRCLVTGREHELREQISAAVSEELGVLSTPPRVVVQIRTESTS